MNVPESAYGRHEADREARVADARVDVLRWSESCTRIQEADPLHADAFFREQFHALNNKKNVRGLYEAASKMTDRARESTASLTLEEAKAVTRDLGFIALALTHHGGAVRQVRGLEDTFLDLASITGDVPSATIDHYAPYNPQEPERMRTFTGTEHEQLLVRETTKGISDLPNCIVALSTARETSIYDRTYGERIKEAATFFRPMITSNKIVREKVPRAVFAHEIQPYFVPIEIGGQTYDGPGGAQISSIMLIDKTLGVVPSDNVSEVYSTYFSKNMRYAPRELQKFHEAIAHDPSLIDRAEAESQGALSQRKEEEIAIARASVGNLRELVRNLLEFRAPHFVEAGRSLAIREVKTGSAGYTEDMLAVLKDMTRAARDRVDEAAGHLGQHYFNPYTSHE